MSMIRLFRVFKLPLDLVNEIVHLCAEFTVTPFQTTNRTVGGRRKVRKTRGGLGRLRKLKVVFQGATQTGHEYMGVVRI